MPFRVVVSERNTWQNVVSGFLQRQLASLEVKDPYLVAGSRVITQALTERNFVEYTAFSVDVVNLFYYLPHAAPMTAVKVRILEKNDELTFRNRCGISVEAFLEVLLFYLASTAIGWNGECFVQRSGVCIGSRVAPRLSGIFLSKVDKEIVGNLGNLARRVFRYVDDYLVVVERNAGAGQVNAILDVFSKEGLGLDFTFEAAEGNEIQFLDLRLKLTRDHVCWAYYPRSVKHWLNYRSGHSKLI